MLDFDEKNLDNLSFSEVIMIFNMMTYCVPKDKNARRREIPTYTVHLVDTYGKFPSVLLETEKTSVGIVCNQDKNNYRIISTNRETGKQNEFVTESTAEILTYTMHTILESMELPRVYESIDDMIYTTRAALNLQMVLDHEISEFNSSISEDESAPFMRLRTCCGINRDREQLVDQFIPFQNTRVYVVGNKNYIDIVPTYIPDPEDEEKERAVYEIARFFQVDDNIEDSIKTEDSICWVKTVDEVWQRIIGSYFYLSNKI